MENGCPIGTSTDHFHSPETLPTSRPEASSAHPGRTAPESIGSYRALQGQSLDRDFLRRVRPSDSRGTVHHCEPRDYGTQGSASGVWVESGPGMSSQAPDPAEKQGSGPERGRTADTTFPPQTSIGSTDFLQAALGPIIDSLSQARHLMNHANPGQSPCLRPGQGEERRPDEQIRLVPYLSYHRSRV